jgi:hypothetical protein
VENHKCELSDRAAKTGVAKPLKDVVARDGVEPPTPTFSGLASPKAILMITIHLAMLRFAFLLVLWEA